MTRLRLLSLLLVLLLSTIESIANIPNTKNQGSAKELKGDIYILTCFISEDEDWTKAEKDIMIKAIKDGNKYLQAEAKKYGVPLNFQLGTFGYEKDIKFDAIEKGTGSGKERSDWVSATLQKVGYASPLQFKKWVEKNTTAKNFHVIIMTKGKGRSFALQATQAHSNSEKYYVEGVVLYEKNFVTGKNLSIGTTVHETLHLYGAWDLYETFKQTADRAQEAKKRFPNSIMVTILSDIYKQNVDELTAWLIGWNDEEKAWYKWFDPNRPK